MNLDLRVNRPGDQFVIVPEVVQADQFADNAGVPLFKVEIVIGRKLVLINIIHHGKHDAVMFLFFRGVFRLIEQYQVLEKKTLLFIEIQCGDELFDHPACQIALAVDDLFEKNRRFDARLLCKVAVGKAAHRPLFFIVKVFEKSPVVDVLEEWFHNSILGEIYCFCRLPLAAYSATLSLNNKYKGNNLRLQIPN